MDEAVRIEVSGKIDGKIARSLRDIAKAAIEADRNLDLLRNALQGFNPSNALKAASQDTRKLRTEIVSATRAQRTFTTATDKTSASLLKGASAADRYGASLRRAETANTGLIRGTGALNNAVGQLVGLFGGIFAVTQYARAQDELTSIQNRIRSLTSDLERQRDIQASLFDLANRTRSGVAATTDGFVRFSRAMNDATDTEVLRFTETLNKLLVSAGRSTAEVNSVVIQLGQALTSGRLQGDEFRSLSENLPREALQAFADQLGVGVEELKALSTQGVITTEVIRNAFNDLATYADEQFARSLPTIGQAITVLNNQFIAFTESSSQGAQFLAQAILFVGNNLNTIIPIVVALAGAWALIQTAKIVADFALLAGAAIKLGAGLLAASSPLLLIVAGIAAIGLTIAAATGHLDDFVNFMANDLPQALGDWVGKIGEAATATDELDGSVDNLATNTTSATDQMTTGFNNAANSLTAANDNASSFTSSVAAISPAANTAASDVVKIGEQSAVSFSAGAQGAQELTAAIQETDGEANALISTLQGIVSWAAQAAAAVGNALNAAANFVDDLSGADGSAAFQIGDAVDQETPAFNNGGSMKVSGRSGVDKNLVSFRASNGERIEVKTAAQQRAEDRAQRGDNDDDAPAQGPTYNFYIQTPDAESFRLSRQQLASSIYGATG